MSNKATHRAVIGGLAMALALTALRLAAQTADEHASHHPDATAPAAPGMTPNPPTAASAPPGMETGAPVAAPAGAPAMVPSAPMAAPGGMMEMMGKMMAPSAPAGAGMAAPSADASAAGGMAGMAAQEEPGGCMSEGCGSGAAKTPIYPSLMTLPALTPEKRAEIDALASQQLNSGLGQLARNYEALNHASQAGDHVAMQQAAGEMREALGAIGAGIAARRVLTEGKSPRNLALDWFKRDMNLASPITLGTSHTAGGVKVFHLVTMVLLIVFALAMVAIYFFKMRRAAALFGRLEGGTGVPPPGSAPPLAGNPGASPPAIPPAGSAPPSGTAPAPSAAPPSSSPPAPAAPPLTANWRGQLRVGAVIPETPSVKTIRLLPSSADTPMPFNFVPGQFLNLSFWVGGAKMNRSYSISSSPIQREYVDLTVRREPRGAVSRHVDDLLKVGDTIEAGGPVGRSTFTGTEADSIVLIAGGVGITPMMSITRYLTERSWAGDIFFLYACRAPADFIFEKDIAELQRVNPNLHFTVVMERADGSDYQGRRGRITREVLLETVPNLPSRRVHLCGPPVMMDAIKAILVELGVPPDQVKSESFGTAAPKPAAAGTSPKVTTPATGPLVTFSKNNKSARIHVDLQAGDSPPKQTVLELSEELGIGIEFSCRVGTCGVCKVKMTSGEVEMAVDDALEPDDITNGIILACQAKPKVDIVVEA